MALQKEIELENGVVLNYHRITSLNKITNINNTIEISSYTSKTQRTKEQKYQELQNKSINGEITEEEKIELEKGINIFIDTEYVTVPYDESMTIENAYLYLKTTDKLKNAGDV